MNIFIAWVALLVAASTIYWHTVQRKRQAKAAADLLRLIDTALDKESTCLTRVVLTHIQSVIKWNFIGDQKPKKNTTLELLLSINNKIEMLMKQFEVLNGKVSELETSVDQVVAFITSESEGPMTDEQAQGIADRIGAATSKLTAIVTPTA